MRRSAVYLAVLLELVGVNGRAGSTPADSSATVAQTVTETVAVTVEEETEDDGEQPKSVPRDGADTPVGRSPYHYFAEVMATTSSNHTPFWLVDNRFGLSSLKKNNGYLRGAFFRDMQHDSRFSWGFGVDLAVPYNFTSHFVVQQLYGEVRWRSLELTIGSRERYMGVVNQELGSGDMAFSRNARPVPQVYLAMPRYEWVPWTRHWLAVKGYFSMGMLTDWRWQKNYVGPDGRWAEKVWYITRGLFLRVGDPERHPLTVEGGLEMGTEFAGTVYSTDIYTGEKRVVRFSHGIKDVIRSIFGMSGGDSSDPNQLGEVANSLGNHVGEWSLAATYRPIGSPWGFRAYYQHYFDDHSMLFLDHVWRDMLVGLEVSFPQNRIIDKFVYEYLTTKDQSGAVYWDHTPSIPEQVSGRDDYYNHYLYPGWSHWGMGMGNPLVVSPIFNGDGTLSFCHNRVKGHHFGFSGHPLAELGYRVLMSYTRSWGTYNNPIPDVLHNFNALLEVTYSPRKISGWDFRLGLAADGGRLLGKSYGAMLTIRKSGWLKR